ncbi:MAG: cytochrome c peroxidase, partial [Phycisphaerae bacterium]
MFRLTVTSSTGESSSDTITFFRRPVIPFHSLKTVVVPEPPNLMDFVKDRAAAIALGKAFFWDMQTGSDGIQACATCHYHVGADARRRNTLHRGANGVFDTGGPNVLLDDLDFPLFNDDIVGSQGVVRTDFVAIQPGEAEEEGNLVPDPVFHVNGLNTRQVTGRNAPTIINAVFNVRSFLDGRANFVFNGVTPFGRRDLNDPTVLEVQPDGTVAPVHVELINASLASQAVGPQGSNVEMIWDGRVFAQLGQKLLPLRPLAKQIVHPADSVLGGMVHPLGRGLNTTYQQMIEDAFWGKWWDSPVLTPDGFTMMEANFTLFWGLAIQMWEATQVSDDAPFDRWREGDDTALTEQQKAGHDVFMNQGLCFECHINAEFTGAVVSSLIIEDPLEQMVMGDEAIAFYDNSFYNIGVRDTLDDIGVGGTDPFGNPLSFVKLSQQGVDIGPPLLFQAFVPPDHRTAVNGAFKVPTLRNVSETAPYMHSGSFGSLREVVNFYARGGDFSEENIADLDTAIRPLPLTPADKSAMVAFLESLTDERVLYRKAPFDAPQIFIPHGHVGDDALCVDDGDGAAIDCMVEIPATGAFGGFPPGPTPTECVPVCGNTLVEAGEDCDDGNAVDGDGCSAFCTVETVARAGDVDGDGDVDRCDLMLILGARN